MDNVYIVDKTAENIEMFIKEGGKKKNFIVETITEQNYKIVYENLLQAGDAFLDFLEDTRNSDSATWCLENDVFYLCTSDSAWIDESDDIRSYENFNIIKDLTTKYSQGYPSAVVQIGCNPGLVSLFVKEAIDKIVTTANNFKIKIQRRKLLKLLHQNKYNEVAKIIGLESIIISDYDTLQTKNNLALEDALYNTWSPSGLFDEAFSLVELSLGTNCDLDKLEGYIKTYNPDDGYCLLNVIGMDVSEETYSPHGKFLGHLITHEEVLSLGNYFSYYQDETLIYKPTVYFSYRPSEIALASLNKARAKNNLKPTKYIRLTDELTMGGEYVGVILKTKMVGSYYLGTGLELEELKVNYPCETPTIIQVSAPAVSTFKWMIENPQAGLLLPEFLPHQKIIAGTTKYLGEYDFHKIETKVEAFAKIKKRL